MSLHPLNQRFADAVKQLRTLGVIRYDSDVAKDLNHSKGNISGYLNGKVTPSEKFLNQFYDYYKVLEPPTKPPPNQPTTSVEHSHTITLIEHNKIISTYEKLVDNLNKLVEQQAVIIETKLKEHEPNYALKKQHIKT